MKFKGTADSEEEAQDDEAASRGPRLAMSWMGAIGDHSSPSWILVGVAMATWKTWTLRKVRRWARFGWMRRARRMPRAVGSIEYRVSSIEFFKVELNLFMFLSQVR